MYWLEKMKYNKKNFLEYSCFALTMKEYSRHLTAAWPYLPYPLLKLPRWTTDRLRTILPKTPCLGNWNTLLKAFKILIKRPGRSGDTIEINGKTTNNQDFFVLDPKWGIALGCILLMSFGLIQHIEVITFTFWFFQQILVVIVFVFLWKSSSADQNPRGW